MKKPSYYGIIMPAILVLTVLSLNSAAVTSKITRHSTQDDFTDGETENIIVDSRGTIRLGRAWQVLADQLEEVWSINCVATTDEAIFFGTSPNGFIFQYSKGELKKIYPDDKPKAEPIDENDSSEVQPEEHSDTNDSNEPAEVSPEKAKPVEVEKEKRTSNEHIFAMAKDRRGKILAGLSGERCGLLRFKAGKAEMIFEPNDAQYIFAIVVDRDGSIYLATGPEGKIYRLNNRGQSPQIIYDSEEKNILSLAIGRDGFIYAGSDGRGLVYKINPKNYKASVVYDAEQAEVTALIFDSEEKLYAAGTSAKVIKSRSGRSVQALLAAGRPEAETEEETSAKTDESGLKLKVANVQEDTSEEKPKKKKPVKKATVPGAASHIYRIDENGFVTDIFQEKIVLFALASQEDQLLAATGNGAQLFAVNPKTERESIIYEDEQASQITAVTVLDDEVYLGTANPAKLIKLAKAYAQEGIYSSDLIDAGQPAAWGKLQLEADIPANTSVLVSARSGNVKDVNDPTFSPWTNAIKITEPIQLFCPLGRFCQYKLILKSDSGKLSPVIREVAVAHTVPNLAPKVESVTVTRGSTKEKTSTFKISYKAKDENNDKLVYRIDFRKIPREGWIELEDQTDSENFEWDTKTVEDGRYEIRVTASDERDNTTATKLAGTRISDPVVVDNTPPGITEHAISTKKKSVTLRLKITDELSAIGNVKYTIDSNADWKGSLPEDSIYDTTSEDFTILIEDMSIGEHVIALQISDAVENTAYKTFDVTVGQY
jgi:outer membrane protein assembly factor BamB